MNRRRKYIADINIIPFLDILLVLLIIFMTTVPVIMANIKINLPTGSTKTIDNTKKDNITITIDSNSQIYLDNDLVTKDQLRGKLEIISQNKDSDNISVIIKSDRDNNYGEIVDIINIANLANFSKIILSAKYEKE